MSRDARVVSLSWTTEQGTVRLDEFRGDVDPLFWKTTIEADQVSVGLHEALWLPTAHRVEVVAADGDRAHAAVATRRRRRCSGSTTT